MMKDVELQSGKFNKNYILQFASHNSCGLFIPAQFEGHMVVDLMVAPIFCRPVLIDLQMSTDLRSLTFCCQDTSVSHLANIKTWTTAKKLHPNCTGGLSWRLETLYMFKIYVHCIC